MSSKENDVSVHLMGAKKYTPLLVLIPCKSNQARGRFRRVGGPADLDRRHRLRRRESQSRSILEHVVGHILPSAKDLSLESSVRGICFQRRPKTDSLLCLSLGSEL